MTLHAEVALHERLYFLVSLCNEGMHILFRNYMSTVLLRLRVQVARPSNSGAKRVLSRHNSIHTHKVDVDQK